MRIVAIGDVHLCEKPPVCRKDTDFMATQLGKLRQIVTVAKEKDAILVIAGDLYDKWDIGFELIHNVNEILGELDVWFVAGNHDLPYHSMDKYKSSPMVLTKGRLLSGTLWCSSIKGYSYGETIIPSQHQMLVQHRMVYLTDPVHGYDANTYDVKWLFNQPEYTDVSVVITGDNHKAFEYWRDDRHVWINTGPIVRTSVTERDYEPSCWFIDTDNITVERIKLKVNTEAVDRTEMYIKQTKDTFVSEFAAQLKQQVSFQLDFKKSVDLLLVDKPKELVTAVNAAIVETEGAV
jgi:DNA repair exonuclease SbcCD nuclease subunit